MILWLLYLVIVTFYFAYTHALRLYLPWCNKTTEYIFAQNGMSNHQQFFKIFNYGKYADCPWVCLFVCEFVSPYIRNESGYHLQTWPWEGTWPQFGHIFR